MKKLFFFLAISTIGGFSIAQTKSKDYRLMGYNTPPSNAVFVKVNVEESFAYKLAELPSNVPAGYVEPDFLYGKTWDLLLGDTELTSEELSYYQEAKVYFTNLSPRVKSAFTVRELWHIYYFDQNLKNQLKQIR